MSKDLASDLADDIKAVVAKEQFGMLDELEGKHVVRDGVVFYVVKVDRRNDRVVVSDTKTEFEQTTTFAMRSFLGKKVEVL